MKKVFLLIIFVLIFSCKEENKPINKNEANPKLDNTEKQEFTDVVNLSNFPNTEFVASLEHPISENKNIVYASTMPYAWDNIKNALGNLEIDKNATDLILLNNTKTHLNSLNKDEIDLEVKIEDTYIFSRAYFKKTLPFVEKLLRYQKPLKFKGEKVENFGFHDWMFSYNTNFNDIFNILYYKSNDDFIFNLLSKDKQHEIIIYKNKNFNKSNLKAIIDEAFKKIEIGNKEKTNKKNNKDYYFDFENDSVRIPVYNFNIETNFTKLENKNFKSKNKSYKTEVIYQRNALILDEFGAIIESEAVDSAAAIIDEIPKETPKQKLFILDSDFIIIAKRKDSKNPYFVVLNRNDELMTKFKKK
ncbi:MAG: hypothetical protein V4666_12930 [Bacteroidota bacterium]